MYRYFLKPLCDFLIGLCALPFKWDYTYKLLARKGQLAERFELTDELRDKYSAYRSMWKYIWVFTTGHSWLLTQDKECDDFEKVVKQQAMSLDTEMAEQLVKLNEELKALQKEKSRNSIISFNLGAYIIICIRNILGN